MLRLIAFGIAASSNGKPPQKPLNPGPLFGFGLLVVIGIVAASGYSHHLTVGLLVIAPIVCAVLVLVGAVVHSMSTSVPGSHDKLRRMKQVQALLQPRCTVCGARPGASCTTVGENAEVLLDAQWNTRCHFPRMEAAVRDGYAPRAEVIAQWDGKVPEGLHL